MNLSRPLLNCVLGAFVAASSALILSGCTQSEPEEAASKTPAPTPPPPVKSAPSENEENQGAPGDQVATLDEDTPPFEEAPDFVEEPAAGSPQPSNGKPTPPVAGTESSPDQSPPEAPGLPALTPPAPDDNPDLESLSLAEPENSDDWHENWMTDFQAAKKKAKKEGKDVLVDFTGTEWCGWCIRLGKEVFSHEEFNNFAKKHFALVKVDFPRNENGQPEATTPEHKELAERFEIQGFPTIFLLDAQGRPYAKTGYQAGGPEAYNEHLKELQQVRMERDQALAAAEDLTGINRAEKLDEALAAIPSELVFSHYRPVVEEVISLDTSNKAGLHEKYSEQLTNKKFMARIQSLQEKVPQAESPEPLLKEVDSIEKELGNSPRRQFFLSLVRINILNYFDRPEQSLAVARSALDNASLNTDYRAQLYITQLRILTQADRQKDALKVVDQALKEFDQNDSIKMEFQLARADFLAKLDREEEAREAVKKARQAGGSAAALRIDQFEDAVLGGPAEEAKSDAGGANSKDAAKAALEPTGTAEPSPEAAENGSPEPGNPEKPAADPEDSPATSDTQPSPAE